MTYGHAMNWPLVYVLFPGTARDALTYYASIFGGELSLHDYAEMSRTDGPADAVAHGTLDGPVSLAGADAAAGESTVSVQGVLLSLLGTDADLLRGWYAALADGGEEIDALQRRPWGDWDGQVRDRFGLTWLVGFPHSE